VLPYSEHGGTWYITVAENDRYVLVRNAVFVFYGVALTLGFAGAINGALKREAGKALE